MDAGDIRECLIRIVNRCRTQIGEDWANDDIALIRGGEEELALEIFCEQVHEIGLSLDRDQKESIRKMIEILAVEPRYFKMIDV